MITLQPLNRPLDPHGRVIFNQIAGYHNYSFYDRLGDLICRFSNDPSYTVAERFPDGTIAAALIGQGWFWIVRTIDQPEEENPHAHDEVVLAHPCQMTLGSLCARLEHFPPHARIEGLCNPHSYKGRFDCIAFELESFGRAVVDVAGTVAECVGRTFTGYNGGDYTMGFHTPVYIARKGSCGFPLIHVQDDGKFVTGPIEP